LSYQVCANGSFGSIAGDLDLGAAFFAGAGFVYTLLGKIGTEGGRLSKASLISFQKLAGISGHHIFPFGGLFGSFGKLRG
jgi:hypothetical protein